MNMDNTQALQEIVREAFANKQALAVKGNGSKDFYGFPVNAPQVLSTSSHQGIINYEANELVLTARAGTPLKEIEASLAQHGQMLSCEAPHFGENATFGGMIAAGLSGPRRPFGSSISDLTLGCKILNGRGEILQFGGQVMKNVAGYDNSRLMVGSMGCLGIILEATVKVVPRHKAERSFRFALKQEKTLVFINKMTSMGYPVSASAYDNDALVLRFSAGDTEIEGLENSLRSNFDFIDFEEEVLDSYWLDLREQTAEFFNDERDLWRFSVAPGTPVIDLPGDSLMEWNGAQRWLKTEASAHEVFATLAAANGNAMLFKTSQPHSAAESLFQPLTAPLMQWQQAVKQAFDPAGIFNPGRMYAEL